MHEHNANKLVKEILKTIARQENRPFSKIRKNFIRGDIHISHLFWEILTKKKPNHTFTGVSHCPGCDKFSLE